MSLYESKQWQTKNVTLLLLNILLCYLKKQIITFRYVNNHELIMHDLLSAHLTLYCIFLILDYTAKKQ